MEIRIETLGGIRVTRGEQELPRLVEKPTRLALLVYLAMERDVTRDVAQGILWSRLSPDRARHALSQALYLLRKELGEDWVVAEGERLRVTEAVTVDALEFEQSVERGALEPALALYVGEFLEGWHLRDTPEFEQWTDVARLRLARLHREALRWHLSGLKQEGRTQEALDLAKAWVRRDPREDRAHHELIELLARSGRRAEALEHFEAYEKAVAAAELPPLEATLALVERIRNGDSAPPARHVDASVSALQGDYDCEETAGPQVIPANPRSGGKRAGRYMAAAVVLAAAGLLTFAALGDRPPPPVLDPDRVLVYPLENRTGDASLDPAGMLAADWITRSLARANFLEVFPTSELMTVAGAAAGMVGTPEDHLARAQAAARATGCGTLVTGAYYGQGPELEFHAQILQAPEWELLESIGPIRTDRADPMDAVDVLGQRVMIGLAFQRDESLAGFFTQSERPPSYAAYVASVQGFRNVMMDRWREAARDLLRANEISPAFTSPLIPAAVALMRGWGDYRAADSVLRIVEASRDRLPPYDRLRLDMVRATLEGDHRRAYRAAREATALVPGASAQISSGIIAVEINRPREALEWLGTFDIDRAAGQNFAFYWDMLTQAHHLLGEHRQELQQARRARERMPDRIEPLWYEIRALAPLGRLS